MAGVVVGPKLPLADESGHRARNVVTGAGMVAESPQCYKPPRLPPRLPIQPGVRAERISPYSVDTGLQSRAPMRLVPTPNATVVVKPHAANPPTWGRQS